MLFRSEGLPLLEKKFRAALASRFPARRCEAIGAMLADQRRLEAMPASAFMDALAM